jgi:hypothetical protein
VYATNGDGFIEVDKSTGEQRFLTLEQRSQIDAVNIYVYLGRSWISSQTKRKRLIQDTRTSPFLKEEEVDFE